RGWHFSRLGDSAARCRSVVVRFGRRRRGRRRQRQWRVAGTLGGLPHRLRAAIAASLAAAAPARGRLQNRPPPQGLQMIRLTCPALAPVTLVVAGLAIGRTAAQAPAPQPSSFTAAQADAGRAAYETNCSGCHLADLQGSFEAPQLSGANFLNQWGDRT